MQVDIAIDGSVEGVRLDGGIHPTYTAVLRQAAETWSYEPATLDGQPFRFRKALKIEIR